MSKWISVKDRLPEEGEDVLFSVSPNGVPFSRVGTYRGGVWYLLCGMWSDYRSFTSKAVWPVTHWMPLPEPPAEEQLPQINSEWAERVMQRFERVE